MSDESVQVPHTGNGANPAPEIPLKPKKAKALESNNPDGEPKLVISDSYVPEGSVAAEPYDPLDLANLMVKQDFIETAGIKKVINTIPVRKPGRQEWVFVRPGNKFRGLFPIIELKDEREEYVVSERLRDELIGEYTTKLLLTTINRKGTLSLWPVRPATQEMRKEQRWPSSMREAAAAAETDWTRVQSNMDLAAYEYGHPPSRLPGPAWPDLTFQQIIRIAFKDGVIDDINHVVIKRLRGLI